jgi:hypothetical protein
MDIEEFYVADERRRRSEEVEIGTEWHDAAGARYELSWVADTGELYVMAEPNAAAIVDLFGDLYESSLPTDAVTVAVVGWIAERDRLEDVIAGWQEAMAGANSIAWLSDRLLQQAVPRQAPA